MLPEPGNLPLDPTPFIVTFFFGMAIGLGGRLYRSKFVEGLGIVIVAAVAVGFPVAEWLAR
jgi:hypothetical protein